MFKKVEVSYTERTDNEERLKRFTEILAEGVYAYLKTTGLLREDKDGEDKKGCKEGEGDRQSSGGGN